MSASAHVSRAGTITARTYRPRQYGKPIPRLPATRLQGQAEEPGLAILADERAGEIGGVMHCFSGDVEIARRCLDLGLFISLAGPVTYKNARALPEVARFVPDDRLVMETDCPYLPPTPHRGKRNEPAYVALTAAFVAELRGVDPEVLGATITANAATLFGITLT